MMASRLRALPCAKPKVYRRSFATETPANKLKKEMKAKRIREVEMESIREDEKGLFKSKTVWVMANPELYMNTNNPYTWRIVGGVWVLIGAMGAWFYAIDENERRKNLSTKVGTIGPRRPDGHV
jgi:hypothetical protein